jgi:hypothetical protein
MRKYVVVLASQLTGLEHRPLDPAFGELLSTGIALLESDTVTPGQRRAMFIHDWTSWQLDEIDRIFPATTEVLDAWPEDWVFQPPE